MAGARILWVDDDARGLLSGIASDVRKCGCTVETAIDFNGAMSHIALAQAQDRKFVSLLADVVLPRGKGNAGLTRYLGVNLVTPAVQSGIYTIAFLTVIPWQELGSRVTELRREHVGLNVEYFSKTHMLDKGAMSELGNYLKVTCKGKQK